jgi:hypothetical protein
LWFWWMAFGCWLTSSLLTPTKQIWYCGSILWSCHYNCGWT